MESEPDVDPAVIDGVGPLAVGDWEFDAKSGELVRGNEKCRLEPRLATLLDYLARRPGQIFSREELIRGVWEGAWVSDTVVWRGISELRRALGDDSHSPSYIETVSGRGYRLIAEVRSASDGVDSGGGRRRARRAIVSAVAVVGAVLGVVGLTIAVSSPGGSADGREANRYVALAEKYDPGRAGLTGQSLADVARANALYERALAIAPDNARARAGAARTAMVLGWLQGDRDKLRRGIEESASRGAGDETDLAGLKARAMSAQVSDRWSEAEKLYRQCLDIDPQDRVSLQGLAELASLRGRLAEAETRYRRLVELEPDAAYLRGRLGWVYLVQGRPEEAKRWLQSALEIEPWETVATLGLARIDSVSGDHRSALRRVMEARKVQPGVHAFTLSAALSAERVEEMELAFRLAADSANAGGLSGIDHWLLLARLYARDGDEGRSQQIYSRLLASYRRMTAAAGDSWRPHFYLAQIYAATNAPRQAVKSLQAAVELGFRDWTILRHNPALELLEGNPQFESLVANLERTTRQSYADS